MYKWKLRWSARQCVAVTSLCRNSLIFEFLLPIRFQRSFRRRASYNDLMITSWWFLRYRPNLNCRFPTAKRFPWQDTIFPLPQGPRLYSCRESLHGTLRNPPWHRYISPFPYRTKSRESFSPEVQVSAILCLQIIISRTRKVFIHARLKLKHFPQDSVSSIISAHISSFSLREYFSKGPRA